MKIMNTYTKTSMGKRIRKENREREFKKEGKTRKKNNEEEQRWNTDGKK